MSKLILVLIVFFGLSLGPEVLGQTKPEDGPQNRQRNNKPEPDRALSDWLRDVGPIISAEEANAWKKLRTVEERERFIETFWRLRDPDPDRDTKTHRVSQSKQTRSPLTLSLR